MYEAFTQKLRDKNGQREGDTNASNIEGIKKKKKKSPQKVTLEE